MKASGGSPGKEREMKFTFTRAPDGIVLSTEAKDDEEALTALRG